MSSTIQTIISFQIPFALPVDDGKYRIKIRNRSAEISIKRIQKKSYGIISYGGISADVAFDKHGKFAYSFIEILFPWVMPVLENGRQPIHIKIEGEPVPPRNKTKEIALEFINRFIDVVRYVTGEYHLEHLSYPEITSYEQFYWDGKQRKRAALTMLDTGTGGIRIGPLPKLEQNEVNQIKNLLENDIPLDIDKVLILNAKDSCLKEDFRIATLDSVIALETVLYRYIRKRGKELEISEKEIEDFIIKVGLTGNINIVLKLLTKDLEQIDDETISWCKGAIKVRNDIVHRGLIEVSPTDAEKRIDYIEKMIAYLKNLLKCMENP